MKENQSPFAIVQIGIGIVCILVGIGGFTLHENALLSLQNVFLGAGVLLYGLTNNNTDKSAKGKTLSYIASVFMILASVLIIYAIFFYHSK